MEIGQDTGKAYRTGQDQPQGGTAGQDRTVTVAEAAELLALTTEAIRKRLQRGQLAGVKIGGMWLVQLDRTTLTDASPTQTKQDGTAGQRARPVQREAPATRHLIEQLRAENDFLKDELRRKDMLLMAFAQGIQRLEAPKPAASPEQPQQTRPKPAHRSWWQRLIRGPV